MVKEKFLMVSLEEEQATQLAEVLSNATSRKIINYLAEQEDATETQVAEVLQLPLSTVHYNLQKLKEAQLVAVEEFHYSKKGREVDHYKLANKYVIITPKPVKGIKTLLRSILPVGLGVLVTSGIIYLAELFMLKFADTPTFTIEAAAPRATDAALLMKEAASVGGAPDLVPPLVQQSVLMHPALWFLIGGVVALVLFLIINLRRLRK